jgi:peroxiredoxin
MSQAEVASAKLTRAPNYPTRGHVLFDCSLPSAHGQQISFYDYRGRCNLIVVLAGNRGPAQNQFLTMLSRRYPEIQARNAEVLLVLPHSQEQAELIQQQENFPFVVLADRDLYAHEMGGALDSINKPSAAVYVTDRFLEVFASWRTAAKDHLPAIAEVLSWLQYIEGQCPECSQAEWPIDD